MERQKTGGQKAGDRARSNRQAHQAEKDRKRQQGGTADRPAQPKQQQQQQEPEEIGGPGWSTDPGVDTTKPSGIHADKKKDWPKE